MVVGFPSLNKFQNSEAWVYGKLERKPFIVGSSSGAKEKLQLVHSNVCGPM